VPFVVATYTQSLQKFFQITTGNLERNWSCNIVAIIMGETRKILLKEKQHPT
jgi:hypothetical protein